MNTKAQNIERVKNGNVILNIKLYSSEKTETVILLHGGPGVPDDMVEVVNTLKEKYRVITFEQRGAGQSKCNKCNFTINDYISDIDAIAKFNNLKSFHLFGHSWGGLYAQIYAKERPGKIKSLFLCSPSSGTNETWKRTEKEVMNFNKKSTSTDEWLKMGWYSLLGKLGSNNAYRKLFKQVLINYHKNYSNMKIDDDFWEKIYAKPINKTRKEIIKYKALTKFENPNYPILITYGDNDIYGESKNEVVNRFPTSKLITINNCGHIPWKHNPEKFRDILKGYYF